MADEDGTIQTSVAQLLGDEVNRKSLRAFRDRFDLPEQPVFGGWTTCFRIETADGYDIVIDCGSGFRNCARDIVDKWGDRDERELFLLGSHSHYDHTEGFEQAAVCFDPRNRIHVLANRQYLRALDQNLGVFSKAVEVSLKGVATPLSYELMPARFDSCEIRNFRVSPPPDEDDPLVGRYHDLNEPIRIGATTIQPIEVFHPSPCLAYRFEHGGKVFVFCTDHELRHGADENDPRQVASLEAEARLREQCMDIDVLYRDGQFLEIEYEGHQGVGSTYGVSRLDWGHSTIEDVLEMAAACRVKQTYIGHHDPNRSWQELQWMDQILQRKSRQTGLEFHLAQAETVIDL
jgi:phosphoribosyl 1,2-cyclic phosphodiesterase